MQLRTYEPGDCAALLSLFYDTVHTVNAADYTARQLDAWAPEKPDLSLWNASFLAHHTLLALEGGDILGFGDIDDSGYLDRLYVHKDHQRQGVATALCDALEQSVSAPLITTHASITARPFFSGRGYRVQSEQQVERAGTLLTNYLMVLQRDSI